LSETDDAEQENGSGSLTELVEQLGREVGLLSLCEARLEAARNVPQVRRAAGGALVLTIGAAAFVTAFVFANVAAFVGLSAAMPAWGAALVLAAAWLALAAVVCVLVLSQLRRTPGWRWWSTSPERRAEAVHELEEARAVAALAVRATLERLPAAITVELASSAVPMAAGIATGVVGVTDDLLEASDDMVEAIADDLPGGGVVNQIWDVVLMPGRFGLRVATTVLRRPPESET
jgi:hypothetical protein